MLHLQDVEQYHNPGAADGYGERDVCWLECPKCGTQDDCDKSHSDDC